MASPYSDSETAEVSTTTASLPLHESNIMIKATAAPPPIENYKGGYGPHQEQPSTPISPLFSCASLCWNLLRCLNTFAVAILTGTVIFLFFQVQYLTKTVQSEQDQINSLNSRLANQTNVQIQELTQAVHEEHTFTLYQMAGTFALLACLLTSFHMYSHLRNYHEPLVQRKIVTILWMSPIYAVTSFFSLVFPVADGYLAVIKDFYEAYAIFTFLSFLIAVLGRGDRQAAIRVLSRHADHLKQPTRCLNSCYHPPPNVDDEAKAGAVVTECQILAMQFVFIRPLTSILAFVYNTVYETSSHRGGVGGEDDNEGNLSGSAVAAYFASPLFVLAMITNVSVFLAFTGLLKFYHAVRDDLRWCQPFSKFMTIKGIVFLTFWQGLLISIVVSALNHSGRSSDGNVKTIQHHPSSNASSAVPGSSGGLYSSWTSPGSTTSSYHNGTDRYLMGAQQSSSSSSDYSSYAAFDEAAQIQNFLICLEMLFFSIAHYCVFPAEEWEPGYRPRALARPGIGLKDFVSDMSYIIKSRRNRTNQSTKGCVVVPSFEEFEDDNGDRGGAGDDDVENRRRGDAAEKVHFDEDESSSSSDTAGFPDALDPEGDVLRRSRSRRSLDEEKSKGDSLMLTNEIPAAASIGITTAASSTVVNSTLSAVHPIL